MLKWLLDALLWNLNPSGVVSRQENLGDRAMTGLSTIGKAAALGECKVCTRAFWGWRQLDYCGTFKCYRELKRRKRCE